MQLFKYTAGNAHDSITSIGRGILYYAYSGRNAWHSTWITRYTEGCMHTTIESAKSYCEKRRQRGTVFYIKELPCIVLRSRKTTLLVTEINHDTPLDRYSNDAVTSDVPPGRTFIENRCDNYIQIGCSLDGASLSFDPVSRFWRINPNYENSIIQVHSSNPALPVSKCNRDKLHVYKSYSNGGNYYLGWMQKESLIKRKGVLDITRKRRKAKEPLL